MPPLPPVAQVVRTRLIGEINTIPAGIRLFWKYSGAATLTNTQCTELAGHVFPDFVTNFDPWLSGPWILDSVVAEDLSPGSASVGSGGLAPHAFGPSVKPMDSATCVLTNFHIGTRYRGGHPRAYVPMLDGNQLVNARTYNTALVNGITGAWQTFVAAIMGHTYSGFTIDEHCSVAYRRGGVPLITPDVFAVNGYNTSSIPATQRRRLGR